VPPKKVSVALPGGDRAEIIVDDEEKIEVTK
jgi:hypothetical protein